VVLRVTSVRDGSNGTGTGAALTSELPVMQRENEVARMVAAGRRSDDGERCSLVLVRRTGGDWCLYPHGVDQFGVRLPDQEARRVAQAILGGRPLAPEPDGGPV
jgi:hypothetical protein